MLGVLSISYLFLGGAGAGALFVLTVLDLRSPWASSKPSYDRTASVKPPFAPSSLFMRRQQRSPSFTPQQEYQGLFGIGYLAGFVVLMLGILCLLADMGRIDRVVMLFTQPTVSYMSLGTYALTALLACTIAPLVVWLFGTSIRRRWVMRAVQAMLLLCALLVMFYTGLIFQQAGTGLIVGSLLVPVLFVLSSFSTGLAVLIVVFMLSRRVQGFTHLCRQLFRADCIIVALELVVTGVLVAQAALTPSFVQTAQILMQGTEASSFWLGFVACGLVVPFVFEATLWRRNRSLALRRINAVPSVFIAALVLVGGFSLRWCVALAGLPPLSATITMIGG